jgi:RNA polymerase-binding transcription factor DksA
VVAAPQDVRVRLQQLRQETAEQIGSLERDFAGFVAAAELVATDDEHDPEGHTIAFERQQVAALLRDARIRLIQLEQALARLDDGTYGRCEVCGEPISEERLGALPGALRCIRCAL